MSRGDVTRVLKAAAQGDPEAAESLLPLVYEELRRLAARRLAGEAAGQTLQATALVHEAYLRLVDSGASQTPQWDGRGHFFAAAAEAMRRILIESARRRLSLKRGGGRTREDDVSHLITPERPEEVLALDEALDRLAALDARQARVVECRFFGGLTEAETAAALGVTSRTVTRDWVKARGWLYQELCSDAS
jgi:RNA polymerase sigma factor (TIGR02999 family)